MEVDALSFKYSKSNTVHEAEMTPAAMMYNLCKDGYCSHGVQIQEIHKSPLKRTVFVDTGKVCEKCLIEIKSAQVELLKKAQDAQIILGEKKNNTQVALEEKTETVFEVDVQEILLETNMKDNGSSGSVFEIFSKRSRPTANRHIKLMAIQGTHLFSFEKSNISV